MIANACAFRRGVHAASIGQACPHQYRTKILAKNVGKMMLLHRYLEAALRAVFDHG